MIKNKYKILFFYTLSSLLLTYVILGKNNISPTSDIWMLQGDAASNLVAWKYFFNDIWRFPIGLNPNYGLSQGSSIIYSGPTPLISIFFKLIKEFLPNNFHFFSIWVFFCFLFQSLFSFLIIKKFTKDDVYALIGSIFLLLLLYLLRQLAYIYRFLVNGLFLSRFIFKVQQTIIKKKFIGFL